MDGTRWGEKHSRSVIRRTGGSSKRSTSVPDSFHGVASTQVIVFIAIFSFLQRFDMAPPLGAKSRRAASNAAAPLKRAGRFRVRSDGRVSHSVSSQRRECVGWKRGAADPGWRGVEKTWPVRVIEISCGEKERCGQP